MSDPSSAIKEFAFSDLFVVLKSCEDLAKIIDATSEVLRAKLVGPFPIEKVKEECEGRPLTSLLKDVHERMMFLKDVLASANENLSKVKNLF